MAFPQLTRRSFQPLREPRQGRKRCVSLIKRGKYWHYDCFVDRRYDGPETSHAQVLPLRSEAAFGNCACGYAPDAITTAAASMVTFAGSAAWGNQARRTLCRQNVETLCEGRSDPHGPNDSPSGRGAGILFIAKDLVEPTSGIEPLTCRLRIDCSTS
jgi:hypothetical protein